MPRGKTPGLRMPIRARRRRLPLYPGPGNRERTTTSEGLRLVPLETHDHRDYRRLDEGIAPPWDKGVYDDPGDGGS